MKEGVRTTEVRLACVLALCVAAVRLLLARPLRFCGTPDACYYLGLGQSLGAGQGFHTRFVYDFQQAHLSLPNTGIEYWRPGISLVLQLLRPVGGVTLQSSIALTIVVGAVFAAAAWHFAMQNIGSRPFALGAFALCLVSTPVWGGSLTPDSGLYYGAAVAWFLALFTVRRQGLWQDLVALLCVAAAYLIRNDAALLLLPLVAVLWGRYRSALPARHETPDGGSIRYAVLMLCGFGLALVPMHLLYHSVLGTAFPSGTAQAFFLNDLSDFVRYKEPVSPHTLLAHGLKHLVVFRVTTFATAIYRIAALVIGYTALIFLAGLFFRTSSPAEASASADNRRLPAAWPELIGPATLFLAMLAVYTLLLPAVGGFSILRSVVGVFPMVVFLVLLGVQRVARTPAIASTLTAALVAVYAVSGVMDSRRAVEAANEIGTNDRAAARSLAALGAQAAHAIVLTPDPVQFSVTTGFAAVALPINGLDAVAAAAHDFGATHVILDSNDMPAPLDELNHRLHPLRSEALPAAHLLILCLPASDQALPANRIGLDH